MSNYYKLMLILFRQRSIGVLCAVSCSTAHRVVSTLAMLLPLKIILMLSHDRVPEYFPEFLITSDFEGLIFLLSGIAVVLYAVGQGFRSWYASIKSRLVISFIVTRLGADSNQPQAQRANKVYEKVLDATSELLFVVFVMLFVTFVFPLLAVSLFGFAILALLFLKSKAGEEEPPRESCIKRAASNDVARRSFSNAKIVRKTGSNTIRRVTEVGYLGSFLVIIGAYALGALPNLLLVFISFIALSRSLSALRSFILTTLDLARLDQEEMVYLTKKRASDF